MNPQKNEMRVHGTQVIKTPITDDVPQVEASVAPAPVAPAPVAPAPVSKLIIATEKMLKNRSKDLMFSIAIPNKESLKNAISGNIYLDRSWLITAKVTYKVKVDGNDNVTFESNPDTLTDLAIARILAKTRGISLDSETEEVSQKDIVLYRENHKKESFTIDSLVL